jgi:translation initiation factor 5A
LNFIIDLTLFYSQISELATSAPGKHGHAKCAVVAMDIFTQKKFESIFPSHHVANVPLVNKTDYTLLDITEDGYCALLGEAGNTREDISLPLHPEGLSKRLQDAFVTGDQLLVTVVESLGFEQIVSFKIEEKHT